MYQIWSLYLLYLGLTSVVPEPPSLQVPHPSLGHLEGSQGPSAALQGGLQGLAGLLRVPGGQVVTVRS